jgi:hypothetical protein
VLGNVKLFAQVPDYNLFNIVLSMITVMNYELPKMAKALKVTVGWLLNEAKGNVVLISYCV